MPMTYLKIFAADIENLTDARYFAAFDVDFLSFKIEPEDEMSIQKALAMAEWIEGPQIVVHSDLLEKMKTINPKAILFEDRYPIIKKDSNLYSSFYLLKVRQPNELLLLPDLPDFDFLVLDLQAIENSKLEILIPELANVCKRYPVFVDVDLPLEQLIRFLQEVRPEGIFIRGGQEEKPGFKSYDELDDWFEGIQSFRESIVE
jgi:phosphoribosylanthranilate isomerase